LVWKADNPQGNEAAKIRWELVPYTRGHGYDLGCGPYKAFPHFVGVDNGHHAKEFGWNFKPDFHVETCEKLDKFASCSADFIFSSHLLEHIQDYKAALREWWRVLKVGGYLCLYLPHKNFYPNIGQEGANPDHKNDFLPEDIIAAMQEVGGWDLVENQERNGGIEYSFFQVYKKFSHKTKTRSCDKPRPEKTCAVIRYGAFGDLLMASSIFPKLRDHGYHITLYTVPRGYEVVKHDPHIDAVILQDHDQVPNAMLGEFFDHLSKKYDKLVNLCESVEGTFLAMGDRATGRMPKEARHLLMNRNYVEFAHLIAGVDYKIAQRFYPTTEEREWAKKEAKDGFRIMWSLAGSSVHKHWPHMDQLLARILATRRDVMIYMVGDESCQILEVGWENEPRVIRKSGKWNIRQSLAFLEQCDMVIGPETGVLNAAALMPMKKIVFLSHSTVENLTRDWVNTTSLVPENTPCYPCHMMHYGFETCAPGYMEIDGEKMRVGALCQVNISVDQAWSEVMPFLLRKAA
jgi:ADP-heptose:LPS heptosyltransferase/predicted SAM-dependent methyltransferase